MSKIIGIDLGSTNSCVSIFEGKSAEIINNSEGGRTTPSVVAFTKNNEKLIGNAALRQMVTNPKNTISIIKRLIGRKFSEVQEYIKSLSYEVVAAPNGDCRVKIGDKEYSPEEISSFIIGKLKADAEAFLGEKITRAVITVPAYFNDSQRQSTKDSGQIAGLTVERILNEPTAAALAYSLNKGLNKKVGVFDLGGSTFDISIVDISDGVVEVLATNGCTSLGGHDIDVALMKYIISEFLKDTGIDISNDSMAMQRVKDECEKAKCALSTTTSYDISLPFITADANGPKHLNMTLTRARLDEIARDIINKTIAPCKKCMEDAGNPKLDDVILVGGQTRMPLVIETVKNIFGIEPNKTVNPDEAVSLGAAIQAGVLDGNVRDILLLDVTPLNLGVKISTGEMNVLIPANTTIPCKKSQIYSNAAPMQSMATIVIAQGNRPMFDDNKVLGQFNVEITPCAVVGQAQVEICFDVDSNGIMNITAKDLALNKPASITITSSSGLSKEEIERAKADAERYAEEDKKRVELVQLKNSVDGLCGQIEKTMKDAGDKITDDEKKSVNEAMDKLKESAKTDDASAIKTAMEALTAAWNPVVSKMYPKTAQAQGADGQQFSTEDVAKMFGGANGPFASTATGTSSGKKDDGPIEAEVVDG